MVITLHETGVLQDLREQKKALFYLNQVAPSGGASKDSSGICGVSYCPFGPFSLISMLLFK